MDTDHGGTDAGKGGMMGKYIIEVDDIEIEDVKDGEKYHRVTRVPWWYISETTLNRLVLYNETETIAEQRGADKAWELARWCFKDASDSDLERAFPFEWNHGGYRRIADMPYIQAAGRYETWQKQSKEDDEVKVGDEVTNGYSTAVVLYTNGQRVGLFFNSGINSGNAQEMYKKDWKKTGRHSPELVEALERLKEE